MPAEQDSDTAITYRKPTAADGAAVWRLIRDSKPLDENSLYCNLIQCEHFRDTCVVAELDGEVVGWVSGHIKPDAPDTVFVWQVAVAPLARGHGVGSNLLDTLVARPACRNATRIETTITRDNEASWGLFAAFASRRGAPLDHRPYFTRSDHFDGAHATEHLVTIRLAEASGAAADEGRRPIAPNRKRGPSMPSTQTTDPTAIFSRRESVARSYCRNWDNLFTTASGSILRDDDGNRFIDFLAGCSALNYGHNDPDMKEALVDHITGDGLAHGLDLHSDAKQAFLAAFDRLILAPRGMSHRLQFTGPTGANAVEAAMKLARKVTGRSNIIAFTNGFHGVTAGALAATGNRHHRMGPETSLTGVTHMPYDDYFGPKVDTADMLDKMLEDPSAGIDAPAAVLLETVQGEGGLNAASPAWLKRVAAIAKKHGALLIVDDIQAGCGRAGGGFFSFDGMGFTPDLITMAKSLSGFGLPFAAVLIKPECDIWEPAEHNGTFRGNTHAFVTGRVALEKFWSTPDFAREVAGKAKFLGERLTRIAEGLPGARLKGRGMMLGIDVGSGELASEITGECYRHGLIIETSGAYDEVVKVLAPLTTPMAELGEGLDILEGAVRKVIAASKKAAA